MPARMGNVIAAGAYRNRIQPPKMIVDAINARPGMIVVEIGCGSGLFIVEVAKAIQPDGHVFAVDIQQGMLDKLQKRMEHEIVTNIKPILADAGGRIPLEDGIADAVFSVAVLPEIPNPTAVLFEIKRLMKDNAVYADAELILDPDFPLRRTMMNWAKQAGLTRTQQIGNCLRYALVFRKE